MVGSLDSLLSSLPCPTTVVCQISRSEDLFLTILLIIFYLIYQCISGIIGRFAK